LAQLGTAVTLQGEAVTVTLSSDVNVTVNDANVVEGDITATNGVIHKIDRMLMPSTVEAFAAATPAAVAPLTTTGTTTGTGAISGAAELLPTPTPSPSGVTTTGAITTGLITTDVITTTDVTTTTGVVTATTTEIVTGTDLLTGTVAVTSVGPISPGAAVTAFVTVTTTSQPDQTIIAVLAARPDLSSTSTAIATAGLAEALAEPGPFTFFAPSNAAFERVDPAELDALLNDNVRLARTMQYHIVADRVTTNDLVRLGAALSTMGQSVSITVGNNGRLLVNGAPVIESIETSNGIIHVLDGILIPAAE
jgi:uncharacterized surface protein with fasciclin (FAS1) repeats